LDRGKPFLNMDLTELNDLYNRFKTILLSLKKKKYTIKIMDSFKLIIITMAIASFVACNSQNKQQKNKTNSSTEKKVEPMATTADPQALAGQWERTDGGYRIVMEDIKPDGTIKASYFNPNSINVYQANWKLENQQLLVFIELRDTNYPGSTYTLTYNKENDLLAGIYFQAAMNQSYEIEFQRIK